MRFRRSLVRASSGGRICSASRPCGSVRSINFFTSMLTSLNRRVSEDILERKGHISLEEKGLMRISVIGLGKLGSPLAAVLAHKGNIVIGVDPDAQTVRLLNVGKAPVFEPGLDALIRCSQARLFATASHEEAIAKTDITFIVVPTPSEEHGGFSLRYILAAAKSIGTALRHKDGFHLIVL